MRLSDPPQADAQVGRGLGLCKICCKSFFLRSMADNISHLTLTLEVVYMGLTSLSGDAMKKHLTGFFKRGHSLNCLHWRYFWIYSSCFFWWFDLTSQDFFLPFSVLIFVYGMQVHTTFSGKIATPSVTAPSTFCWTACLSVERFRKVQNIYISKSFQTFFTFILIWSFHVCHVCHLAEKAARTCDWIQLIEALALDSVHMLPWRPHQTSWKKGQHWKHAKSEIAWILCLIFYAHLLRLGAAWPHGGQTSRCQGCLPLAMLMENLPCLFFKVDGRWFIEDCLPWFAVSRHCPSHHWRQLQTKSKCRHLQCTWSKWFHSVIVWRHYEPYQRSPSARLLEQLQTA